MEHGQKSFVDDWKNCDGNWIDDWKNCDYDWDVASGFTLSGHYCFSFIRNSGNFSSLNCTFEHKNYYGALKRPHSWAQDTFVEN